MDGFGSMYEVVYALSTRALPRSIPDEVEDQLSGQGLSLFHIGSAIWTLATYTLHSGDCKKTAFLPGPGLGLLHIQRINAF